MSIVIPTRNRPAALAACLQALTELECGEEFEVVVVDDRSAVPLDEIRETYARRLRLKFLRGEGRGPARARNLGAREARGEFLIFTDDDCRPAKGWLAAYGRALACDPQALWGGEIVAAPEAGLCGGASQLLISYLYQRADQVGRFFCSNNIAMARSEFLEVGGFDESFPLAAAEDREFCERWGARYALRRNAEAVVVHCQAETFASFCRQHFRYGRGAYHYRERRRQHNLPEIRIYPLAFYTGLLRFPFGRMGVAAAAASSLLLSVSQIANAAGFLYEGRRSAQERG